MNPLPARRLAFFVPTFKHIESVFLPSFAAETFAAVSITGSACSLGCDHCRGLLLRRMIPVPSPEALLATATRLHAAGCRGLLVSGGATPRGEVPLWPMLDALREIKRRLGIAVVVHAGFAGPRLARGLKKAGIDRAMIDVMGSDDTVREVYHLDHGIDLIRSSLSALEDAGVATVPHVVVGIRSGRVDAEDAAIVLLEAFSPKAVVFVILTPLRGTPMQDAPAPPIDEVARLFRTARSAWPSLPLSLGCARPSGQRRLAYERAAIEAGFDALAFPSDPTIRLVDDLGIPWEVRSECCGLVAKRA